MLASSIGFLFVTQMITSTQNITTLESFTEGITKHVNFIIHRTFSRLDPNYLIYGKFLEVRIGLFLLILSRLSVQWRMEQLMYFDVIFCI